MDRERLARLEGSHEALKPQLLVIQAPALAPAPTR